MIFELHENQTGQQQHRQSVKLMIPGSVIPQHCFIHTHTDTHTHTHTPTRTGLLHSAALQLTASLGVVFLSSWLAEIKQVAMSLSLLRVYLSHRWWSLSLSGAELQSPAPSPHFPFVSPPDPSHQPPTPGSPCAFDPAAGARLSACRFRRAAPSSVWSSPLSPLR